MTEGVYVCTNCKRVYEIGKRICEECGHKTGWSCLVCEPTQVRPYNARATHVKTDKHVSKLLQLDAGMSEAQLIEWTAPNKNSACVFAPI